MTCVPFGGDLEKWVFDARSGLLMARDRHNREFGLDERLELRQWQIFQSERPRPTTRQTRAPGEIESWSPQGHWLFRVESLRTDTHDEAKKVGLPERHSYLTVESPRSGYVHDGSSLVEHAEVLLQLEGFVARTKTDGRGRFHFPRVPFGLGVISASKGDKSGSAWSEAIPFIQRAVEVSLKPSVRVRGKVLAPDGRPVREARLIVRGDALSHGSWTTDDRGKFEIQLRPGWIHLTATALGFSSTTTIALARPDLTLPLRLSSLVREPGPSRRGGRVVGATGPVDAWVDFIVPRFDSRGSSSDLPTEIGLSTARARTSSTGVFEAPLLPPGRYWIRVEGRADFVDALLPTRGLLIPLRGSPLLGRVAVKGEALSEVEVDLVANDGSHPTVSTRTSSSGSFRFESVEPGAYEIRAGNQVRPFVRATVGLTSVEDPSESKSSGTGGGFARIARKTEGDGASIHVELTDSGRITGSVVDEAGRSVPLAEVRAVLEPQVGSAPCDFSLLETESETDGTFELTQLCADHTYRISAGYGSREVLARTGSKAQVAAKAAQMLPWAHAFRQVRPNAERWRAIRKRVEALRTEKRLPRTLGVDTDSQAFSECEIRRVDSTGKPRPGLRVTLRGGEQVRSETTGSDGAVLFRRLSPGQYRVRFGDDHPCPDELVELAAGERGHFELADCLRANLTLRFRDVDGQQTHADRVHLVDRRDDRTDRIDGNPALGPGLAEWTFLGVPVGDYDAEIELAGADRFHVPVVVGRASEIVIDLASTFQKEEP
ncbi:MAG: carboxypeptidase regulatory-like domain-containing protein [Deltaproteobacteria bacterium]|nr:carboxypeptidase regulatory-like domain-containing protein [Deltaproteobacteria bacterium]